ncbi:MAG: hypothetical protein WAS33_25355 [Candidatus Promineifilaceae bacterium]
MIEIALILLLLLGLFWWLNPWSASSRKRQQRFSDKSYWQDGRGY